MSRGRTQCQALVSGARQSCVCMPLDPAVWLSLQEPTRPQLETTVTLGSEHQKTHSGQGRSGKGHCRPQQTFPSSLSGSRRPSHILLPSPTGLLLLLLRSFNKDKQDESLKLGEGRDEGTGADGVTVRASLASSQLSRLCAWCQKRCRSDQRNPRSGAFDARNS